MKKHIRLFVIAGISLVAAAALYAAQVEKAAKPAAAKRAVMRTASEMKWVDIPDTKGAQQSVAWGNAEKGRTARLPSLKAEHRSPCTRTPRRVEPL